VLKAEGLEPPSKKGPVGRATSFLKPYLLGAGGSVFLFAAGWTRPRHRAAIVELCHHFGYRHESREPAELPAVPLTQLVPGDSLIDVRAIDAVDGNVTERELITICRLIRAAQPTKVFEIGTFDGRTTLNMAVNAGSGATVHTLDLPKSELPSAASRIHAHEIVYADKSASGERFRGTDAESSIVQLYGDSGNFDFARYYGTMDFVFIDGSHMFDYVVNDSLHAQRMLKDAGGTIVWHDYGRWDGVTGALNQLRRKRPEFASVVTIAGTTLAVLRR
jgi:predicted O-methyltransferase YrrM